MGSPVTDVIIELLTAIDQLLNTLVWDDRDGWGKCDETLSARAYRLREHSTAWSRFHRVVDTLFFWQDEHCFQAYKSEVLARQLPAEYYLDAIELFRLGEIDPNLDIDAALRKIS